MTNPLFDALFGDHIGKDTIFLHLPDGDTLTHDGFLKLTARYANAFAAQGLTPETALRRRSRNRMTRWRSMRPACRPGWSFCR